MGTLRHMLVVILGLVSSVHLAAVPTQDTLVITRSDASTKTPEVTTEVTTEEPNPHIKLTEMYVNSFISLRYAHTAVVTHVKNPAKKAQEATFRMLLPEKAFISGFIMTLDGKPYKAYVKKKEDAKNIFNDAVSHGFGAALIGSKARDSNHFTISVNVEPNTLAIFNLTYEELLVRRNGVYNHAINLHPGAVIPKLKVKVHIKETEKVKNLRVPEVRTGNEIDASSEDAQNPNAVIERTHDDREAIITFTPDLEEQKRLMDVYTEKSKETNNFRRSFSNYPNKENEEKPGILGQFVVQYDVDRPSNGEVLVNDGYFVHFYAPANLPPLNKHVVFVLDTSGSMSGPKINQLREAMKAILSELNEGDYFNIVEFSNGVKVHKLEEADKDVPLRGSQLYPHYELSYKEPVLEAPSPATKTNIHRAKVIVERFDGAGGTNIDDAIDVAVKLVKHGLEPKKNKQENLETATVEPTSVSGGKKLEPIIIFLTDGEPTIGETDTRKIINNIVEKNYGESQASIYSLAFGEDADREFLRKLSLRNAGFMRHIYEAADAALQLKHFYREVASPLLSHARFTYPTNQVKGVTKSDYKVIYDGSEVMVAGQYNPANDPFAPTLSAFCGIANAPGGRKKFEATPKVSIVRKKEELPLERLWAYLTIKQLLDQRDADVKQDNSTIKPEDKALELALKYEFVTPLTSLVVVKPNSTNAVNPESVDKENTDQETPPAVAVPPGGQIQYVFFGDRRLPSPVAIGALPAIFGPPAYSSMLQFKGPSADSLSLAFPLNEPQEEQEDYEEADHVLPSTPRPNPLTKWKLEAYPWAQSMLKESEEALEIKTANGTVLLKLINKNEEEPTLSSDVDCALTQENEAGSCVYLTRCQLADTFTQKNYVDTYCTIGGYAGVCCPKNKIDVKKSR